MAHSQRRTRWIPLLAAALFLGACGDDGTDPVTDYDPLETLDRIDAVIDPLDLGDEVFDGIWLATESLYQYGASPMASLVRSTGAGVFRASMPESGTLRQLADGRLARAGAGADADGLSSLTLPTAFTGETLVWDPNQQAYVVSGLSGAPADGVRFIYYVTDSQGYPTASLVELGHIDLTDEDRSLAERVGVQVVEYGSTSAQDRLIADYYVEMAASGSSASGTLDLETVGDIDNGFETLGFELFQQFTWSETQDYDRLVMEYLFDPEGAPVALLLEAESGFEAAAWEMVDIEVRVGTSGSDLVEIEIAIDASDRLTGRILEGGRTAIEISGTDGNPQFERAAGDPLTGSEIATLEQIWIGISDLMVLTEWLMVPSDLLLLAG